ncbi:MAG: hypothetical protein E6I19_06940 [Chloroflexi bacterium]|nr:MAG: hypothetical protein E6I19_06940 [Chloroflexota bacterium]
MADTPPPPDRPSEKPTEPTKAPPSEKAPTSEKVPTSKKPAPSEKAPEPASSRAPVPPRGGDAALPLGYAGIIAVLLVVAAIGGGLAIGTIARPSPTPRPTPAPTVAVPTRTPVPTTDPQVFFQQLSAGCATEQGLWVVANGGALLRYDGKDWAQVDSTLRTLTNASCDTGTVYAVGPVGAVLIVDDRARSINAFDVTVEDLRGVAAMSQGAMVVGTQGMVQLLSGGTWQPYASGIEEDLNGLIVFGLESAWVVGSQGISYRLEVAGWRPVKTGVDVTLRAIAGPSIETAVAVGDGGTILALSGLTWTKVESGVDTSLRAVAAVGSTVWTVGDGGVVLTVDGALVTAGTSIPAKPTVVTRVDIGTTCSLTSVFAHGQDIWIVGSRGGVSGVWRLRDGKVAERWGECS